MFRGSPRPRETAWSHQSGKAESGGQPPPPPIPTRTAPSAPSQLPTWEDPLPLTVILRRRRAPGQGRCPPRATQGSEEPHGGPGQSCNRSPPRKGVENCIAEGEARATQSPLVLTARFAPCRASTSSPTRGPGGDGERGSAGPLRTSQKTPRSGAPVKPAPTSLPMAIFPSHSPV